MNQHSDVKRLALATTALASTIMEIINDRLRAIAAVQEQKIAHKLLEPLLTKKQAVEYFQVSLRTIEYWLEKGHLPHYRIGPEWYESR